MRGGRGCWGVTQRESPLIGSVPRARPELADLEGIRIMELSGGGYDTCFEMSDVLIAPPLSMIGEGGAPIV